MCNDDKSILWNLQALIISQWLEDLQKAKGYSLRLYEFQTLNETFNSDANLCRIPTWLNTMKKLLTTKALAEDDGAPSLSDNTSTDPPRRVPDYAAEELAAAASKRITAHRWYFPTYESAAEAAAKYGIYCPTPEAVAAALGRPVSLKPGTKAEGAGGAPPTVTPTAMGGPVRSHMRSHAAQPPARRPAQPHTTGNQQ
ncbi:hypothetical protein WJX75_004167 [Coccomyxa subellipsoidea]|uniref:Uncharacterized protein n=1 Tax=Coccomyxa subellipsoidea TaxID=248742 RepID=A0ABR2YVY4_9CHLO